MSTAKLSTHKPYRISPPPGLELEEKSYLELFRYMKLNRMVEERLGNLYRQSRIVGGLYSSLGQEATSVGSAYALEEGDFLAPMIRNLGSVLVRGIEPLEVFLQYLGRKDGPTAGKDGNLHFGSLARGVVSPVSMLGTLIPVMAGVALAFRMKGKKKVVLTYIGDGGTSTGDFHEGLNFASVRRLPLILIVENNLYAYSTPVEKQMNIKDIAIRAKAYGIPGWSMDGNNVLEVYEATRKARELCLQGKGPVLLEAKTFRRKGHAEHDDASYVPEDLRREWEAKDPIEAYASFLLENKVADRETLEGIEKRIAAELEEAVAKALSNPYPEPETALEGVYAEEKSIDQKDDE